jgi:heterodisulfide reductase subunit A2
MKKQRIGVYICHCGGNISDYIDVGQLSKLIQREENIFISRDVMFACADSNQKEMIQDIQDQKLDAIVVASCSPKLHTHTFRNVAIRAGINQYNYTQVNIREQCSWAHSDTPMDATIKAYGLIRAGINRVSHSESLENMEIKTHRAIVIVGAGVSGMRAAIDSARMGNHVYLLEKDFFVGGHVPQLGKLFPTNEDGKDVVTKLYNIIRQMPNINLFTGAHLEKVTGSVGNFTVEVKISPRFIAANADPRKVKTAFNEGSPENIDPLHYKDNLNVNGIIYKNYSEACPDIPVVDVELLKRNIAFYEKYIDVFDVSQKPQLLKLNVGSVLVTTGFDFYQPVDGEFGYRQSDNVIALPDFKKLIELNSNKLIYNNKPINSVAFIYCVGNRQAKGENKYCSRQCCTATIHTSVQLHEKFKGIKAYHLYRDIRTYGKQELLYQKSSEVGDIYLKFEEKEPPVVEISGNKLHVRIKDYLTSKKEITFDPDLVVLVTGMVARDDRVEIAGILKIPIGSDKFYNEIHPKLKPVETVIGGVYIGGACQGPKNIAESVQSALSGAAKINALIKRGIIELEPIVARINSDACVWCGECAAVCEYDTIKSVEYNGKQIAEVNTSTCKGCGICAPVCQTDAIELIQYTNNEIESMIDGFMSSADIKEKNLNTEDGQEEVKTGMKEYPQVWNQIVTLLDGQKLTIPQISEQLGQEKNLITYHMMTMNKYNVVEAAGLDDNETYFLYKLKK